MYFLVRTKSLNNDEIRLREDAMTAHGNEWKRFLEFARAATTSSFCFISGDVNAAKI